MSFNLGFNYPGQTMGTPPPTMPPPTTKAYNLGFGLPMAVTPSASNSAETSMNVVYGINNIRK
jgi:hypothetical protein